MTSHAAQPKYRRTIKSTSCFIHCGEDWLFIHRTKKGNDTDAHRLNGVGGKLEPGENYLDCAIRETYEETGYKVTKDKCSLAGVVNMEGGYKEDWLMCFFVMEVDSKEIPIGTENDEGQLIWLHQDEVLDSDYELVDDLNYCWPNIITGEEVFFAGVVVNDQEKVQTWNLSALKASY